MRADLLAYINTDYLLHNLRALRGCLQPPVKICAALKADAYGHGIRIVAPVLHDAGVEYAAVATVPEAVELRQVGWKRPILVLGNVLAVAFEAERAERLQAIIRHKLAVTVSDAFGLSHLARTSPSEPIEVHLKIDSGMGRMGVMPDEAMELTRAIRRTPQVRLVGVYSHFATADLELRDLAARQLATFQETLTRLSDHLPVGVLRHMANSAATISLPQAHFDMVRPGLAIYGYLPAGHMASRIDLRPILRLVSHVSLIKNLPPGHCVGYGHTFTTARPTRLGIVSVGYADGFVRALSNNSVVTVGDHAALVIGRVSMDQLAVDLTDLPRIQTGDEAVVIDDRPDWDNSVAAIARRLNTIPYEVTCLLGRRLERVGVGGICPFPPGTHN